jgi:hypothetical protein
MPPGTPYNAFVLPYKIRVDEFAESSEYSPALHLLTHTHTDHINGLSAKSFGYTVICSHDAKEMLLRHQVYAERALHEQDLRSEQIRTFSHLKIDPFMTPESDGEIYYNGSRDLLVSFNNNHAHPGNRSFSCRGLFPSKRLPWFSWTTARA